MKFHSGTHSGTAVSDLEMVNFSIIEKRGEKGNQIKILHDKKSNWFRRRHQGDL
jgi:hypothetical protein